MATFDLKTQRAMWLVFICAVGGYAALGFALPIVIDFGPELLRILAFTFIAIGVSAGLAGHLCWRKAQQAAPGTQPHYTFTLLAWALDETLALFGLILALGGIDTASWLLFLVPSVALLIVHRPAGRRDGE